MSGGGCAHCDPKHALNKGVCLCFTRPFTGCAQTSQPGHNFGWVTRMGPLDGDFKSLQPGTVNF